LAEAVIAKEIGRENVASAGFGQEGLPVRKKIREYAAKHGLDLTDHRSVMATDEIFKQFNLVLYMDGGNLKRIPPGTRVQGLGEYIGLKRIADPAFQPKGPATDKILNQIVEASKRFSDGWHERNKRAAR